MQSKLDQCFTAHPEGLTVPAVKDLVKEVRLCLIYVCCRLQLSQE